MATVSPGFATSAHGQNSFGAVEAYLAQAQAEIGRAFLELTDSAPATPTGESTKYSYVLLKPDGTCETSLDELSAWADRLAGDLDTLLTNQLSETGEHPGSARQSGDHSSVQNLQSNCTPYSKALLPVKYSSLPTRSGQECQRRVSGLSSTGRRHRRRSWPPDRQRPLWEDRRVKRHLMKDASVQTYFHELESATRIRLNSDIASEISSACKSSACKMENNGTSSSSDGTNEIGSSKANFTSNSDILQIPHEVENLVLPSERTFTAKQALKVQTASLRKNHSVTPKVKKLQSPNENLQKMPSDKWTQYIMWWGSPYARIHQWKAEDEDISFLEKKEFAKLCTDDVNKTGDKSAPSLVSHHELESFLRKVERSTYRPPSFEYASLQDAATQTSGRGSPSSIFAWQTEECDCNTVVSYATRWRMNESKGAQSSTSSLLSTSSSSPASTPPPASSSSSSSSLSDSRVLSIISRRSPAPLANKSASAPMLRPQDDTGGGKTPKNHNRGPPRAHSDRHVTELEAVEACTWLRAAGFPQYAQMYEDNQFPIDIGSVRKDHNFLDPDAIYSLFRRLNTLNKCARLKNSDFPRKAGEESDDADEQCALSENWQFQPGNKRWSRVVLTVPNPAEGHTTPPRSPLIGCSAQSEDSVFADEHFLIVPQMPSVDTVRQHTSHCHTKGNLLAVMTFEADTCLECMEHSHSSLSPHDKPDMLRRSGSERLKDSARALFRRVESIKNLSSQGKRKKNREVAIIGGPAGDNKATIVTSSGPQLLTPDMRDPGMDSPDLSGGSSSMGSTPLIKHRKGIWLPSSSDNSSSFSDSECVNTLTIPVIDRKRRNEGGSSSSLEEPNNNVRRRTASFKKSQKEQNRGSIYDNVPSPKEEVRITKDSSQECLIGLPVPSLQEALEIVAQQQHGDNHLRRDSGVGASLTRQFSSSLTSSPSCWHCFSPQSMNNAPPPFRSGNPVSSLTVHQCNLLRKVSFLKATAVADKHCPASKHANWNWGVTKILKKMKTPDYKDKTVFGVPLSVVVQRNGGQPLPPPIQTALCHLHATALDAQGLFRKSGVRSRIARLRQQCEMHGTLLSQRVMQNAYEQQQAYDVADMVKQYFRELPDSLLTAKQSEILINVYQYVPEEERLSALVMCILYLPDENREALQCLLHLLHQVALNSELNQMSASNLGVCLAPSLFQLGSSGPGSSPYSRSSSSSPRRRRNTTRENSGNSYNNNTLGPNLGSGGPGGMPDQRELDQSRAAHTCLTDMILHYRKIFLVPEEASTYQRVSSADNPWDPMSMEDMGNQWQSFSEQALQEMLKECHDKNKSNGNWSSVSISVGGIGPPWDGVDVWQRKVGDGHPLKLWKVSVEIEAPPADILHRILNERYLWDVSFVDGRVLAELDSQTDVYLFWQSSVAPLPLRQFCLLRGWRQEKGHCVLVEASVEHGDAPALPTYPSAQEVEVEEEMAEDPEVIVSPVVLASRFLFEPCGAGRTRATHISRTDLRGRSVDWYNSFYGHVSASMMSSLRDSFRQGTVGPETKV